MNIKRYIFQLFIVLLAFLLVYLTIYLREKGQYVSITGFCQGTSYLITYESKKGENIQSAINSLLSEIDLSLSIYNPHSVISRFNQNESGTKADEMFIEVFNKSYEVYQNTGGAFDITMGPIVNALGFGSTDRLNVDRSLIDSLMKFVGMNRVRFRNNTLIKDNKNIMLDFNGIAQGYSVDLVAEFLNGLGIKNYLIEIGGEVRCKGTNKYSQTWRIGIEKPVEGNTTPGTNLQVIIGLNNKSLATSGNYRKYYEKDGVKYVHTVNPKTGYPVVSNLLSASVIADDCMSADAYATALMVFGVDKSIGFLNGNEFLEAYLIYSGQDGRFQIYATPGFDKFIAG